MNITTSNLLEHDNLFRLRIMCVEFFLRATDGKTYNRRPPIALRLPCGDLTFVVKPTTTHRSNVVTVDDRGVIIECIHNNKKKGVVLLIEGRARYLRSWKDQDRNISELSALVELAEQFRLDPFAVMKQNPNHCCCCGKALTDAVSRARGIGPECLGNFSEVFGTTREPVKLTKQDYKRKMIQNHPDMGGDPEEFKKWSALYHAC